jgi:hypothetical protein
MPERRLVTVVNLAAWNSLRDSSFAYAVPYVDMHRLIHSRGFG